MIRTQRADRGAIIPLTGLLLVVIMTSVAFAVDLGRLASERRSMQADADVVALDLVRLADGRTEDEILLSSEYAAILQRSAAANSIDVADLLVEYGTYDAATDTFVATGGTDVPNAVQVRASSEIDYFFAQVFTSDQGRTNRSAIAGLDAIASLTLGSNTVSLDTGDSTALNFLLETMLDQDDIDLDTDFVGYEGLADADVDLDDLVDADASAGTPQELLDSEVTAQELGTLYAQALRNNGRTVEADILDALALQADNTATFDVGDLLGADVGGPPAVADAGVNAFDQFIAGLQLANEKNFANVCTEVPGTVLAGLAATSLEMCTSVIEAGKTAIGRVGSTETSPPEFRTAQVRVSATSSTNVNVNLAIGRLTGSLTLPVTLEGGGAEGTLTQILCDRVTGQSTTDTVVSPRAIAATIAGGTPLGTLEVRTLLGPIARIGVSIDADGVDISPTSMNHLVDDQLVGTTEQAPGAGLGLSLTLGADDLDLDVTLLGFLGLGPLLDAVTPVIAGVVNGLISGLASPGVSALLDVLGLGISESDLRLNDVVCDSPLLRR